MGRRIQPDTPKERPGGNRVQGLLTAIKGLSLARFGVVLLLLGVIGGGLALGWFYQSQITVRSLEVSGNHFTSESDILAAASILIGTLSDSVRLMPAILRVEKLPYVQQAYIRISSAGRTYIRVSEREPIGLFINGTRRSYVDANGILLPIQPGKSADVPLVYGINWKSSADTLSGSAFRQVRDFLISARSMPVAWSTLSEIAWTPDEGIVALSHENGIRLVFGNDRFEDALRNWDLFYRQVVAVRGASSFSAVDLRYNGQIVTRES